MSVKKWICCAVLFYICYLIIQYLDRTIEKFGGRGGRGGYYGRHYGGRGVGYYGGRGVGYYGGRNIVYPVVADNYYPSYWWYPSYWQRYVPYY